MIIFILIVIKDFKYIIINLETSKLKYFSIFAPLGKSIYFQDYKGKMISKEYGSLGAYSTLHLVDEKGFTSIKFSGLFYENFDELNQSIPLKKISFHLDFKSYLKIIFLGKVKVK